VRQGRSNPNGMKLGRTQARWPGITRMLGSVKHLLYVWGSTPLS